jgi:hypothetical protein
VSKAQCLADCAPKVNGSRRISRRLSRKSNHRITGLCTAWLFSRERIEPADVCSYRSPRHRARRPTLHSRHHRHRRCRACFVLSSDIYRLQTQELQLGAQPAPDRERSTLDHVLIFGPRQLERVLEEFIDHYHSARSHQGPTPSDGACPCLLRRRRPCQTVRTGSATTPSGACGLESEPLGDGHGGRRRTMAESRNQMPCHSGICPERQRT